MSPSGKTSPWVLAGVVVGTAISALITLHLVGPNDEEPALPETENSIGMEFVRIPPGQFVMGSPTSEADRRDDEEQHEVEITSQFCLGKFEVTQGQFQRVMGFNPSAMRGEHLPAENVSWDEAVEFCHRLSALSAEKAGGRSYRLPTEAEWEYACRAGQAGYAYSCGHTLDERQANINYPDCDAPPARRVGLYPANAWGLHDMHGNVWEWCRDYYKRDYYRHSPLRDPQGPETGDQRVRRGGSRANQASQCRSAHRSALAPNIRLGNGLRVVMVERETP